MALFNDGIVSELRDLRAQEASLLETANQEGIDLAAKMELAQKEIGIELTAFLLRHGVGLLDEAAIHGLSNVAVTPALQQWHVFQSLALAYRDLYHNQLNDRFGGKWREWTRLAVAASQLVYETGVGIVWSPVPRAGRPEISLVSGAAGGGTYFVRVAWVNGMGDEGSASEPAAAGAADGLVPQVTPVINETYSAAGWNVYAGPALDHTPKQNDVPLAVGTVWTMPDTGLRAGRQPGHGQTAEYYVRVSRRLWG